MKNNFARKYVSVPEILADRGLAKVGDVFVNFVFSLAVSNKQGIPTNIRVSSTILSQALKKTGHRKHLPSRTDRHEQGDAVEALIFYSWLEGNLSLEECVSILQHEADIPVDAFATLITTVIERLDLNND
jgi:hypothetical protein